MYRSATWSSQRDASPVEELADAWDIGNLSMKTIVGYQETDRGLFLDLADQIATLAVNRKTGDVLLDEGAGDDRINSAAILLRDLPRFILTRSDSGSRMHIEYGAVSRRQYNLGKVEDAEAARAWVCAANAALDRVLFTIELQHDDLASDSLSPVG